MKNEHSRSHPGPQFVSSSFAAPLFKGKGRSVSRQGYLLSSGVLLTEQDNKRLKNTDHRFTLVMNAQKTPQGFRASWKVESTYDFEPFAKGDVSHLPLASGFTLKLPDGLSEYLTQIGVAKAFKHSSEWQETWK